LILSEMKKTGLFDDPDLKTPMHDEIMVWLDSWIREWENIFKLRPNLVDMEKDFESTVEELIKNNPNINKTFDSKLKRAIAWEHPICGYNGYVHGFVDLRYTIRQARLLIYKDFSYSYYPAPTYDKYSGEKLHHEHSISFEVKSKIYSVGELIRQVSLYRNKLKEPFVVVAPDVMKYKDVLNSQRIGCIEYPTGEVYL